MNGRVGGLPGTLTAIALGTLSLVLVSHMAGPGLQALRASGDGAEAAGRLLRAQRLLRRMCSRVEPPWWAEDFTVAESGPPDSRTLVVNYLDGNPEHTLTVALDNGGLRMGASGEEPVVISPLDGRLVLARDADRRCYGVAIETDVLLLIGVFSVRPYE